MMISIVVAAAFIVYAYSSGLLGSLQGAQPQQPFVNHITLEYYDWTTLGTLKISLRNTGTGRTILADIFVNATAITSWTGTCTTYKTSSLTPQSTCTAVLTISKTPTSGFSYVLKLVTKDGSIFTYNLIAGKSGTPT